MANISVIDSTLAQPFRKFRVGDQVVFKVTGVVNGVSMDSATVEVTDLSMENDAGSVQEAARRAENELTVRLRTEPSIG